MVIKAFIIGAVLVGITIILTEVHRYQVYKADIEQEDKQHDTRRITKGNRTTQALD